MMRLIRLLTSSLLASALLALPVMGAQGTPPAGGPYLFNGHDLSGWQLRHPEGNNLWKVEDSVLINEGRGTDLVTGKTFTDPELHIEFRVPPRGNSGVYLPGRLTRLRNIRILPLHEAVASGQ